MAQSLKIIIFCLSFTLIFFKLSAQQEECSFTLEKAQKLFNEGRIREIPGMLSACIENGFTREEKTSAYKLIILSYVADDNKEEAQRQMLLFLKKYPEYKVLPTDPSEFQYLHESFNTIPLYTIGLLGGVNNASVRLVEQFGTHDINKYKPEYSKSGLGISGGLRISRYINKNIDLNIEGILTQSKFECLDQQSEDYSVSFTETDTRLLIPISANYTFTSVPFIQPYFRLGLAPGFILNANATAKGLYLEEIQANKTGQDINLTNSRNNMAFYGLFGGGLRYKIPRGYIHFDVRFNNSFITNVEDDSKNDQTTELLMKYNYIEDNYYLNNLQFSISYSYIFYKPEKKNK